MGNHVSPVFAAVGSSSRSSPHWRCCVAASSQAQAVRDYISIVGSSTVYPFATVVAEQFGRRTATSRRRRSSPPAPAAASSFLRRRRRRASGHRELLAPDHAGRGRRRAPRTASRRSSRSRSATTASCSRTRKSRGTISSRCATSSSRSRRTFPNPAGGEKLVPNPYRTWSDDQPGAARRRDRGARSAADLGHARRVQRARDGGRLQDVPLGRGACRATRTRPRATRCAKTAATSRPARTTT